MQNARHLTGLPEKTWDKSYTVQDSNSLRLKKLQITRPKISSWQKLSRAKHLTCTFRRASKLDMVQMHAVIRATHKYNSDMNLFKPTYRQRQVRCMWAQFQNLWYQQHTISRYSRYQQHTISRYSRVQLCFKCHRSTIFGINGASSGPQPMLATVITTHHQYTSIHLWNPRSIWNPSSPEKAFVSGGEAKNVPSGGAEPGAVKAGSLSFTSSVDSCGRVLEISHGADMMQALY